MERRFNWKKGIEILVIPYDLIKGDESLLSPFEKKRMQGFKFDRHREKFLKRITWVKTRLSRATFIPPTDICFEYGQWGKPFIPDQKELDFSYSHSGDYVMLTMSNVGEVGCDVERIDPTIEARTLCGQFFSPEEIRAMLNYDEVDHPTIFFNLWTRKEAFIKAVGQGLSYGLNAFSVQEGHLRHPKLIRCKDGEPDRWEVFVPERIEGYEMAVVLRV